MRSPRSFGHNLRQWTGRLPVAFERNDGQTAPEVSFLARFRKYTVFLTSTGMMVCCPSPKSQPAVSFRLLRASKDPEWEATRKLAGIVNYFLGSDPTLWRRNIPTFSQVQCGGAWPGITVVYYGSCDGRLEVDFIVEPGADPDSIRLAPDGADDVKLTAPGDLVLHAGHHEVRFRKPVIYQEDGNGRSEIEGGYVLDEDGCVAFTVASYDTQRALVIDPVLVYSTLLGGSFANEDRAYSIAVDEAGQAHVAGAVQSLNFPTQDPYQPAHGGLFWDGVVAKLNATGTQLVYSTYLGGSSDDFCQAIAIDTGGNACVAGVTSSQNFPTTTDAYQETHVDDYDAFVTKLNTAGSDLIFSTFLGGSEDDGARAIAVDASDAVYITGYTESADFPVTENAVQENLAGGIDAFVAKLSSDGESLLYSTFLGGNADDEGKSIAVDSEGAVYVAGYTRSDDLQTTSAVQPGFGGDYDAFIAKLTSDGGDFVYFTYLGGSEEDGTTGCTVALDQEEAILVTTTGSNDFPTLNALQPALAGIRDIAVARFSGDGTLVFSTYLGGPLDERAGGVAIDSQGNIVLAGAAADGFPTVHPIQQDPGGGFDAFIAILTGDGSKLLFSTLLGGGGFDGVKALALDSQDGIYITGDTQVGSFPTTPGAFQLEYSGYDLFIAKISRLVYPYEYAALFVSGIQHDPANRRLARGAYATTVNVHNPNVEAVLFFKKLALTFPPAEQRPGEIFPISTDALEPDQTLKTDGDEIAVRLFPNGMPAPVIQGFLVIQSQKPLDVTAIYTTSALDTRGQVAAHTSIHVEQIRERVRQADLSIDKTADIVRREEVSDDTFEAEVLYTISVRSNGPFAAEEIAISDILTAENAEFEVLEVPAPVLDPLGTFTVESQTGTEAEISIVMAALSPDETAQVEFRVRATYTNGMGLVRLIDRASVSHALIDPSPEDNSVEITTQLWP